MKMNYDAEEERAIQIREFFKEDDDDLRKAAEQAEMLLTELLEFSEEEYRGVYKGSVLYNLRAALEKTI